MIRLALLGLLAVALLGCGSSTPPPSPGGEAASRSHKGQTAQTP